MLFGQRENINFRIVFRLLGLLLLIEAAFMLIPLATGFIYGEYASVTSFLYSLAITAGAGIFMAFLIPKRNNDMGKREGFMLTVLTWLIFSIFGMLPFLFEDTGMSLAGCFFETMSGFTTTGASVFINLDNASHAILIWRAMTHFLGGLGIILFTLAVIPMLNKQSGIQLFNAEVTGITHDKLRPRISHTAKSIWAVYIVLSFLLIALLWIGPMDLFDAICHSFSAISTGGFATKSASIAAYDSDYAKIVLTVFMFLSGVNFALLYKVVIGNWNALFKNDALRWYAAICAFTCLLVIATQLYDNSFSDISDLLIDTPFQIISAITSTGFVGTDMLQWHMSAIVPLTLIMIIGSCSGSTAGGIKVDRVILLYKNLKNEIYKILHPNTITPIRVNGKVMSNDLITKTGAFLLIFFLLVLIGTGFLIWIGIPVFDSLFAAISCISNNGLGFGVTYDSFATVPDSGKWMLSGLMLVGRLEIFTVIILFTRAFWNKE